jgi:hypothetical protein
MAPSGLRNVKSHASTELYPGRGCASETRDSKGVVTITHAASPSESHTRSRKHRALATPTLGFAIPLLGVFQYDKNAVCLTRFFSEAVLGHCLNRWYFEAKCRRSLSKPMRVRHTL